MCEAERKKTEAGNPRSYQYGNWTRKEDLRRKMGESAVIFANKKQLLDFSICDQS